MAEFYFDNLAKNLPDAYKKGTNSNNYKILEIDRSANADIRKALDEIAYILDIDNAKGAVLDMYGERFGQKRGAATDAQYVAMIKSKIVRGLCSGSYKDIVDAICHTFGCGIDDVILTESADKPMTVTLEKAPLTAIIKAGFTTSQAYQLVKNLLPTTVELESVLFEGSFEFAETDNEYDEAAGFAISDEDQSIGGYLGAAEGDMNEAALPI